jgi:hypothetical protein
VSLRPLPKISCFSLSGSVQNRGKSSGLNRERCYSGRWGEKMSLNWGHAHCSSPRWYMRMENHGWLIQERGNQRTRSKTWPDATSSTINHTWTDRPRTRASAVRSLQITAWTVPWHYLWKTISFFVKQQRGYKVKVSHYTPGRRLGGEEL